MKLLDLIKVHLIYLIIEWKGKKVINWYNENKTTIFSETIEFEGMFVLASEKDDKYADF